jgi:hypothetical protein
MDSLLPFLQGSCIPYNMPVYPGALRVARHPPRTKKSGGLVSTLFGECLGDLSPRRSNSTLPVSRKLRRY